MGKQGIRYDNLEAKVIALLNQAKKEGIVDDNGMRLCDIAYLLKISHQTIKKHLLRMNTVEERSKFWRVKDWR